MTLKGLIVIAILALPSVAAAACGGHERGAASCPPGQIWDSENQQCMAGTSS